MNKDVRKRLIKRFFIVFGSMICAFAGLFGIFAYVYINYISVPAYSAEKQEKDWDKLGSMVVREEEDEGGIFSAPSRTNFLVVGQDKSAGLTDTIMVGSYVTGSNQIYLMSVPRDTYIVLERDKIRKLNEVGRSSPSIMKINSLYAYAGDEYGMEFLQTEVEELLDIDIDYYVMVDLEGFKSIVDTIGGIDFDVPEGGLYYSDPTQGLYINLKGGMQHLDGEQAEGLVRFRKGYARQDLQRVEVQQQFIKEFVKQLMQKDTLTSNMRGLFMDFMNYVQTDFGLMDLPKYISCISQIDGNNITSTTLPGYPEMIDGASYYMYDKIGAKEIVDEYFFGIKSEEESSEEVSTEETTRKYN